MIKIFNATETIFTSNGEEVISEYSLIETKKKSLNGWYIDVECPIKHKDLIVQDNLAVVKTKSKLKLQAFRIDNIKYTSTKIKFTANHVMFDAHRYFLLDVRPTNSSAINALEYTSTRTDTPNPFKYTSNVNSSSTAYFIRKSLFEAWAVIEERWEGVFDADNFDITFNNEKVVDRGATLNYGVDLEGIEVYEDWSGVVTRLYPTGFDGIMLPEKMLISKQQYEQPYSKTIHFDTEFEEEDRTPENLIPELRKNAIKYIDINQYPMVSYTVKSDINQDLEIGDLVVVKHPYLNIETQVQEYTYDVINNRVKSLTFGNFSRDVKTKFGEIKDMISQNKNKLSNVEALVHDQTNLINSLNKNGYVYIDDNEILIVDKLPKEQAKNVWRFGLGGLGFSSSGYEGPFDYAFTQDGKFNASFIAAGSIVTNQLAADVGSSLDISSNKSIKMLVENLSEGNLILNLNARLDIVNNTYPYYYFNQNGLQTVFQTIQQTRHAGSPIFVVVPDKNSVSGFSKEYRYKGKALATEYAYIVPDTIYSYRCKRTKGSTPMDVYVVEYDGDKKQIKRTKFTLDGQNMIESFSFTPAQMTMWVRLEFYNNIEEPFNIAEEMFVRGEPVKWSEDANEVRFYSKSLFEQLSNKMVLSVDSDGKMVVTELGVDPNTGSYFTVKADQIRLEGVITADGNLKIFEDGSIEVNKGIFRGEINTDKNVRLGTYLSMPLPEVTSIIDMINNRKKGIGGVSWGGRIDGDGNLTEAAASITSVKGIGEFSEGLGTRLSISSKGSIYSSSQDFTVQSPKFIQIDASESVWSGNDVVDMNGGMINISPESMFISAYKNFYIGADKSFIIDVKKGRYGEKETQFRIEANSYNDADNLRIGNNRGTEVLVSDKGIGTIALHTPRVGLWLSPSNDNNTISLQSKQTNTGFFMDSKGSLLPSGNVLLGWDTHRWQSLYLLNQPNVSSDKRYKYNIHDIDPLLLDSFEELKEKGFVTKHDDKFSYGYIAQDVERCLFKYVTKVWGFKAANEWISKFKLLQQSESYKSLLYAEVQVIMQAVERRQRERLELEVKQLRREHETLVEILKEKGVI